MNLSCDDVACIRGLGKERERGGAGGNSRMSPQSRHETERVQSGQSAGNVPKRGHQFV